jgi:Ca-activated chloride channel homolog
VLDTSGSVDGEKLAELQSGIHSLLGGLRAGDEAGLVTFDHEIRQRVPFTTDLARVERGVRGILPGGSTALLDALYAGTLLADGRGRSLLVLFSDGEDNVSWLDSRELVRVLEQSNVLVQVVGIVAPPPVFPPPRFGTPPVPQQPPQVKTLRRLAEVTGGRFWPAASAARLAEAFGAILEAMRTRYVLRFEPPQPQLPGLHAIDVRLVGRRGSVHCRPAYFVPPAPR